MSQTWTHLPKSKNAVQKMMGKYENVICHVIWHSHMSKIVRLFSVHIQFSSVAQSCPTLRPHESQHARPPCPSSTPRVHSNSCPSSRWCHPAVSTSVVPFSSCPQSLPASESFPMSQLFTWDGQSIGVSALASVLLMNTPGLNTSNDHRGLISFRMGWLDLLAY